MGRILNAWDLHLGRSVAIKILRRGSMSDLDRLRFLEEAQVTGQLQHPSIMPIYDIGRLRGQLAFVMKRIEGRSLKELIALLRRGGTEAEEFNTQRLLNIFHQLCQAVAFSHSQGVVHRDLKPSNVMVGDFGEVVLLDWGLCKIIGQTTRSTRSSSERWQTVAGQIIGTPAYMAPEQAMGIIESVDLRTDVYGLGAILYHLLSLKAPFSGKSNKEIIQRVLKESVQPLRQRAPEREIHPEIERICMRCLQREQEHRYPNAGALSKAIGAFLEAPLALRRPSSELQMLIREGRAALRHRHNLLEDLALARDRAQTARLSSDPFEPPRARDLLWAAEDEVISLEVELAKSVAQAESCLRRALDLAPRDQEARRLLIDLYSLHLMRAREDRDHIRGAYYRQILEELDEQKQLPLLSDKGRLRIDARPKGVSIYLSRFVEHQRRLLPSTAEDLGVAPINEELPAGFYQINLQAARCASLLATVEVEPGKLSHFRFRMLHRRQLPKGFVHIPAGTFCFGGGRGLSRQALNDFLIAEEPVKAGDYLHFLRSLSLARPQEINFWIPRRPNGEPLWPSDLNLPSSWSEEMPVVGITQNNAQTYCRWYSEWSGLPVRLPTEQEWEKAGRGGDGRRFPWGDHWVNRYAVCPDSWSDPLPAPVGYARYDRSPFGVQDLAGGVREWTSSFIPGRTSPHMIVRGGSYLTGGEQGRPLWFRDTQAADRVALDLGFRLLAEIPESRSG